MNDLWIILTGVLVSVICGWIGVFLVARKMAMVADAISHAVLPGIVISYIVTQSRSSLVTLPGAMAAGMLVTFLVEKIHRSLKVQTDAAIGISFTGLFAFGIILLSVYAGNVDLDQDCVLYGDILFVPFDKTHTGLFWDWMPRPVWILSGLLVIVLVFVLAGFKGLVFTSFDPMMAAVSGISATVWHYALMSVVSLTTIVSFESVGAILVLALLVAPAATARLLTDDIRKMLWIAPLVAVASAVSGYYLAYGLDASVSGGIATMTGVLFFLTFLMLRLKALFRTQITQI